MRDYYLCYPAILTNALVPQPTLSSILQNQLGVALDALTLAQWGVSRSGQESVMAVDRFFWNTIGPPQWECEAMGSWCGYSVLTSAECI